MNNRLRNIRRLAPIAAFLFLGSQSKSEVRIPLHDETAEITSPQRDTDSPIIQTREELQKILDEIGIVSDEPTKKTPEPEMEDDGIPCFDIRKQSSTLPVSEYLDQITACEESLTGDELAQFEAWKLMRRNEIVMNMNAWMRGVMEGEGGVLDAGKELANEMDHMAELIEGHLIESGLDEVNFYHSEDFLYDENGRTLEIPGYRSSWLTNQGEELKIQWDLRYSDDFPVYYGVITNEDGGYYPFESDHPEELLDEMLKKVKDGIADDEFEYKDDEEEGKN